MWKNIFKTTLIAGALDILAAFVQAYISKGLMPKVILQFIASGIFGEAAYSGDFGYILFGLLVHFFIAFAITSVFFFIYPKISFFQKNILFNALLIAVSAWFITQRIVIPMSRIGTSDFDWGKAILAIAILFFCIGIPVSYFTKKFYNK
ncbi:MAG: hypothetical protein QM564_04665 [Bergeyella sp.]